MITATNTLSQNQQNLDVISNNISNMNTAGYKAKQANFQELLYQQYNNDQFDRTVRQSPVGIRYGVGAHLSQIQSNQKQGNLQMTDRDLDVAMTKENLYFNVLMPEGEGSRTVYTRKGEFYVSPLENGTVMLVNADGYPVADENGNVITMPEDVKSYNVNSSGTLTATYADNSTIQFNLGVTEIHKPQLMEHIEGGSYFGEPNNILDLGYALQDVRTNLVGADRTRATMQNGALEMSNVDVSKEMADLIATQRSYQFNSRAITLGDQMLGLINGIR